MSKYTLLSLESKSIYYLLVWVWEFSDSNIFSMYEFVKDSLGVILFVFKILNSYVPILTMHDVYLSNGPSPTSMICSEIFKFNLNAGSWFLPMVV